MVTSGPNCHENSWGMTESLLYLVACSPGEVAMTQELEEDPARVFETSLQSGFQKQQRIQSKNLQQICVEY